MREIGFDETVGLLNKVIALKGGDFTYKKPSSAASSFCANFHRVNDTWEPGCIIGHVLAELGVTGSQVTECESLTRNVSETVGNLLNMDLIDFHFSFEAMRLMGFVQSAQDDGISWGESLRRALVLVQIPSEQY